MCRVMGLGLEGGRRAGGWADGGFRGSLHQKRTEGGPKGHEGYSLLL